MNILQVITFLLSDQHYDNHGVINNQVRTMKTKLYIMITGILSEPYKLQKHVQQMLQQVLLSCVNCFIL